MAIKKCTAEVLEPDGDCRDLGFAEYQKTAAKYDSFQATDDLKSAGFTEKTLGLVGEAGEVADKVKKIIRDKGGVLDEADRVAITKELGDVLWYVASLARYLGVSMTEVAAGNLEKLEDRHRRNKLHGEGDDR